jgi:hypothetical protein
MNERDFVEMLLQKITELVEESYRYRENFYKMTNDRDELLKVLESMKKRLKESDVNS